MKEGDQVPDLSVPNQDSKRVSLTDFKGKWVVLYFYPRDNTPGCTVEAIDFTSKKQEFERLNTVILGVSKDSVKSHCSFIEKQNLKIDLLSDEEKELQMKFGVWAPKKFMGREFMGTIRSTFLIDPKGKVAHMWKPVKVKGHVDEVLEKLREL